MAGLLLNIAARGAGLGASAFSSAFSSLFSSISGNCFNSIKDACICPHPTECGCIGAIGYFLGCQDHRKFNLIIDIHELDRLQKGSTVYLQINVGRIQVLTKDLEIKGSSISVEERLFIKVRQIDKEINIQLIKKGVLKTEIIAIYKIRVKQDLIDRKFPKRQWYTMSAVKGASNVKVLLSFHYMDPSLPAAQSPLLQQAILLAQQEAEAKKEPLNLDLGSMGEKERLIFFSKVLEGPLQQMASSGTAWTDLYFKAIETAKDKWEWICWHNRTSCYSEGTPVARYALLGISLVLPDAKEKDLFYVRYYTKEKKQENLFFKSLDRSRDLWADGLFEFIDKLRAYLDLCATAPEETYRQRRQKKKKRQTATNTNKDNKDTPQKGPAAAASARCLASPRGNVMPSARRPSATKDMLKNLMYTEDEEKEEKEEEKEKEEEEEEEEYEYEYEHYTDRITNSTAP